MGDGSVGSVTGAGPVSSTRVRKGALAPKRRAGIGSQPIESNNRRSHQPGSFRHTTETGSGHAYAQLTTRKRS